jgi:hypothetical protein
VFNHVVVEKIAAYHVYFVALVFDLFLIITRRHNLSNGPGDNLGGRIEAYLLGFLSLPPRSGVFVQLGPVRLPVLSVIFVVANPAAAGAKLPKEKFKGGHSLQHNLASQTVK